MSPHLSYDPNYLMFAWFYETNRQTNSNAASAPRPCRSWRISTTKLISWASGLWKFTTRPWPTSTISAICQPWSTTATRLRSYTKVPPFRTHPFKTRKQTNQKNTHQSHAELELGIPLVSLISKLCLQVNFSGRRTSWNGWCRISRRAMKMMLLRTSLRRLCRRWSAISTTWLCYFVCSWDSIYGDSCPTAINLQMIMEMTTRWPCWRS